MQIHFKQFFYSDMASELYQTVQKKQSEALRSTGNPLHDSGIDYTETHFGAIRREKLVIADEEAASLLGKSIGIYYTVHTGDLRLLSEEDRRDCKRALQAAVVEAVSVLCPDFQLPTDPWKNNTCGETTADLGFDKGTVLRTSLDDPGEDAWDRLAVSPEWDQGGHLHPVPPACKINTAAAQSVTAEGEPFVSGNDTDRTAVTDIPPCPLSEQTPSRPMTLLVVGLGNPALTTDALGPMSVSHLHITRHMVDGGDTNHAFPLGDQIHRLCAVTPLVLGKTGIETLELVRGAVQAVQPDLVILIDALAASALGSLSQTVQISTTGIHPGGGVGNKRQPLTQDTLGVPVMTVGVPTVVAASTLIYRALEGAGILPEEDAPDDAQNRILHSALASADVGYVAPKDIDESVAVFSCLIADIINELALGPSLASSLGKCF